VKVDITFDNSINAEPSSVWCGIKFIDWMNIEADSSLYLRPLAILLKKLVAIHNYNVPFHGGISSYVLTLMTSAFLRESPKASSIAQAFIHILSYYGAAFDPNRLMIYMGREILDVGVVPKQSDILVTDPFKPQMNAASTLTQFAEIRQLFFTTYRYLIELIMSGKEVEKGGILKRIYSES